MGHGVHGAWACFCFLVRGENKRVRVAIMWRRKCDGRREVSSAILWRSNCGENGGKRMSEYVAIKNLAILWREDLCSTSSPQKSF